MAGAREASLSRQTEVAAANFMGKDDRGKRAVSDEERAALAGLASVYGFGAVDIGKLMAEFGTAEEAWGASVSGLKAAGLSELKSTRLAEWRKKIDVGKWLEELRGKEIRVVCVFDEDFPKMLSRTRECPYVLFVRGKLVGKETCVAVVGTRRPSRYAARAAGEIASGLAAFGVSVVSGLALGVDAIAHRAALEANGRTVAVLGNGIDRIYPASNYQLGKKIIEGGAVVSEFPPGVGSLKQNFPARNRIVSGMSLGVVVVEGSDRSGTLITAKFAKDQGRRLWAVPGEVTNFLAAAPNRLIREGASLVRGAEDVIEELVAIKGLAINTPPEERGIGSSLKTGLEKKIFELVALAPRSPDRLVRECGLGAGEVTATLTALELNGVIEIREGRVYVKARKNQR